MKKKTKRYLGIISGMVILLLFMMPICYIESVEVINNNYYSEEEILKAAQIKRQHFLDWNFISAKRGIKDLPYINDVRLKYHFPGKIQINVSEKVPFAYVDFKGTYLCINEQAQVIEQTQEHYQEIPMIEGLEIESFKSMQTLPIKNQDTWLVAQAIVKELVEHNYGHKVSRIDVHNLQEIHLYVDKLDVIIGSIDYFDDKIEVLKQVHDKHGYTMGQLNLSVINTKLKAAYLEPSI